MDNNRSESIVEETSDPFIRKLNKSVVLCVKFMAIFMVLVIWLALIDVIVHLYQQMGTSAISLFSVENLLNTLGDFLAVMIAIEIFLNIIFYLKKDVIHAPLVLSTALTAVARKVIVLDTKALEPQHVFAMAAIILAIGLSYWLVSKK